MLHDMSQHTSELTMRARAEQNLQGGNKRVQLLLHHVLMSQYKPIELTAHLPGKAYALAYLSATVVFHFVVSSLSALGRPSTLQMVVWPPCDCISRGTRQMFDTSCMVSTLSLGTWQKRACGLSADNDTLTLVLLKLGWWLCACNRKLAYGYSYCCQLDMPCG